MTQNENKLVPFPTKLVLDGLSPHESVSLASSASIETSIEPMEELSDNLEVKEQSLNNQGFSLKVEDFDGPIDLLLHLVKRNELPIEKLSLAKVADQFLQCIKQTVGFDLELAGEYLVIAANLLSIKAALIVDPKSDQQLELDDGPNPHDELLKRLREAEVYQEAARMIASKDFLGIDVFSPAVAQYAVKKDEANDPGLANHDAALLAKALKRILSNIPAVTVGLKLNWTRISIGDRMQFFVEKLKQRPGEYISFEDLLGNDISLPIVVSSFVALLELCKRRVINIAQNGYQDSIALRLVPTDNENFIAEAISAESEFDVPAQVGNIS